jgi:hypothetical protein
MSGLRPSLRHAGKIGKFPVKPRGTLYERCVAKTRVEGAGCITAGRCQMLACDRQFPSIRLVS